MQTKDGAALRKRREMAGFSLEDIAGTHPVDQLRQVVTRRARPRGAVGDRALPDLDRLLSSRLRQRAAEFAEYMRENDQAVPA